MQDWKEWIKEKKIVLVAAYTYPYHAGAGLNAFNFGKFLVTKGYQTKVLSFNRNFKLPARSDIDGLKIYRIPYFNKGYVLKIFSLIFILPCYFYETLRNDIIIIYGGHIIAWEFLPLFGRLVRKRVIFQSTMYGDDDIESLLECNIFLSLFKRFSLKSIQNYMALTPSFSESYHKNLSYPEKIIETPQGVNTDIFYPVDNTMKKNIRMKLGIPENAFVIISVGMLVKRKGYIEIFHQLTKLDFPFTYIVLGDFDLSNGYLPKSKIIKSWEIYNLGGKLLGEKIIFKGYINNVNEYLQASDVFLMGSNKEGLSNALLEAMATGLPIIVKETGAIDGYILNNKQDGLVFNNYNEIPGLIKELFFDRAKGIEMGFNARKAITEKFSFSDVYDCLLKT